MDRLVPPTPEQKAKKNVQPVTFPWIWLGVLFLIFFILSQPIVDFLMPDESMSHIRQLPITASSSLTEPIEQTQDKLYPISKTAQQAWCAELDKVLRKVAHYDCMKYPLYSSHAKTVEGRDILLTNTQQVATDKKRRILVMAAIHGDELSSALLAFRWLPLINSSMGHDYEWRVIPVLNVDGLLKKPAQRMNGNGVDLNRNFPMPDWIEATTLYWEKKTKKDPRRYPGKAPLSEPESKWFYDEVARYKPDVVVAIHAPYGILDFDGPVSPPDRLGPLELMRLGVYPGSLGNLAISSDLSVLTIELPNSLEIPKEEVTTRMLGDLIKWVDKRTKKSSSQQDTIPHQETTASAASALTTSIVDATSVVASSVAPLAQPLAHPDSTLKNQTNVVAPKISQKPLAASEVNASPRSSQKLITRPKALSPKKSLKKKPLGPTPKKPKHPKKQAPAREKFTEGTDAKDTSPQRLPSLAKEAPSKR